MDGEAWWAAVHGVEKSWTRVSDFTLTFHFHALEKEMATHSSVLAWRIPGTGEPDWLPSMGLHGVGHDWSDLAAAAAAAWVLKFLADFIPLQWRHQTLKTFHSRNRWGYKVVIHYKCLAREILWQLCLLPMGELGKDHVSSPFNIQIQNHGRLFRDYN